jgi:tRNA1(Val) A37 N6-methylase TrmN6
MNRFDTPPSVAAVLTRHAPRRINRLLDPAVGSGVLVQTVGSRLVSGAARVVCIDVSCEALTQCRSMLRHLNGIATEFVNEDFLNWDAGGQRFDCVIMNPPFCGKKRDEVHLRLCHSSSNGAFPRTTTVEAAFLLKAIELLEPAGRLLAVLPPSVILGQGLIWLRLYLLEIGSVRYVHELPRFTFCDVESRVYLLVFDKGVRATTITLQNHDLHNPSPMFLMRSALCAEARLDFGFCSSHARLYKLLSRTPRLRWTRVGECATIYRGRGESPHELDGCLHTRDYDDRSWKFSKRFRQLQRDKSDRGLRRGDLFLTRVGRNCSRTLRLNTTLYNRKCSDCVLIVRPAMGIDPVRLLLAMRALLESDAGPSLLERGAGARYITEATIKSLKIPLDLAQIDKSLFWRYRQAVRVGDVDRIRIIEAEFRTRMGLACEELPQE